MNRSTLTSRRNSFVSTMNRGFNHFQELDFKSRSNSRPIRRIKTDPNSEVQIMLKSKRDQFSQIRQQLKEERQMQMNDFVKKSLKYQELLDINDNKKKRLPTLNSKIGAVKRVSFQTTVTKHKSFSLSTCTLPIHESSPPTRQGHTALIYRKTAVIFGGHCSHPYAQGHVYSLNSHTWTQKFNLPSARSYHSTVLYKDRYAIIFGGMGSYDVSRKYRACFNSVNIVDLHTLGGKLLKMKGQEFVEGRRAHGCTLMGKYMLVFGGINTRRQLLNDLLYLDLKEMRWYQKEYMINSGLLLGDMEKGIAHHKAIAYFRPNHSTLPFYSSDYSDLEGIYFFGGCFGNGNDNFVLFMGLNTYNPCLRRVIYSGTPPASINTLAQKIDQSHILIISGELNNRGVKLYKIRERQFVGVYDFVNTPSLGGMGSTLSKHSQGFLMLFGLTQNGYSPEVVVLDLHEKQTSDEQRHLPIRKGSHMDWKMWDCSLTSSQLD